MFDLLLIVAYALFSSVLWRLGGGAFTTLTGVVLGTDMARMFRVAIATVFVLALPPFWIVFGWAALFLGLIVGGWAPFQEMGLQPINMPEPSWLRWLPERLGLKIGTLEHDFVGMAEAGFFVMLPLALLLVAHRALGGATVMLPRVLALRRPICWHGLISPPSRISLRAKAGVKSSRVPWSAPHPRWFVFPAPHGVFHEQFNHIHRAGHGRAGAESGRHYRLCDE